MTDDTLLIDVLRAAGFADAAALATKVFEAREPAPPEPEPDPEPEPLTGAARQAAMLRDVMRRDLPRIAQAHDEREAAA